jgi:choline dehydrogenase-like flavoprotein
VRADAVVIGSGAAGSVMSYELARRGLKVVVLEQGGREDPTTFEHDELRMFPRVYKQGGLQSTEDHDAIIVQGATVGGSTVINNAIWLRADLERILPDWERNGAHVPAEALTRAYGELETALRVDRIRDRANPGTGVFLRGCEAAGIPGRVLDHNRVQCLGCGWCNYGCRYGRKTSMLITYIPWAEAKGAEVLDRCDDVRITVSGKRATGATAVRAGRRVEVTADRVVVCAGAIGSSAVLLASGITQRGRVGKRLHVLGGIFVSGEMDEVVDGFAGIGLTCVADEQSRDYVIESYFSPPVAFSLRLGGWFGSHFARAERYRHFIDGGVMVGTAPEGGDVRLDRKGNVKIRLKLGAEDLRRLRLGLATIARIYLAAGARRVLPATYKLLELTNEDDLPSIETLREPDDLVFGSAHPQGGNVMHRDPDHGVVDEGFAVHGMEGLYVADTSVWPTNIWANCQATAMATAHYAATRVAA